MFPIRDDLSKALEEKTPELEWRHNYAGYFTSGGVCNVRIWGVQSGILIIVATELPENRNTSITNMAEILPAEIIDHLAERGEIDGPCMFTYIEHSPKQIGVRENDEYSSVAYTGDASEKWVTIDNKPILRQHLGTPNWKLMTVDEVAKMVKENSDRAI